MRTELSLSRAEDRKKELTPFSRDSMPLLLGLQDPSLPALSDCDSADWSGGTRDRGGRNYNRAQGSQAQTSSQSRETVEEIKCSSGFLQCLCKRNFSFEVLSSSFP